jgi:hypothetical protein
VSVLRRGAGLEPWPETYANLGTWATVLRCRKLRRLSGAVRHKPSVHSPEYPILRAPKCLPGAVFVLYTDLSRSVIHPESRVNVCR